ncbi:amino acid ABC transporter substrate-binding protein [Waterburya agarophytonicola K14]|uniref:Amino acid ABC transporter substrate-binding protein n=1 Tax=Waterburya agarophytonicola KI4 TaxID=2874699 RepID=A0A964FKJ2_9CYAN|nr:amino acid ABC transporter substrate-binding protein [Waterburya agarophytonicola]MCC0178798.1 amino acid ABC transporter substrate-binding protein [Waterburya agarophytonicola KI4]
MLRQIAWKQKCSFLFLIATLLTSVGGCSGKITQANITTTNLSNHNSNRLDVVKQRGYLICGISGEIPGFSFVDFNSRYAGIDVDFCRAVASALFDDPEKVEFRELGTEERFSALKSGEIDLLSRNTTQTLSRDTDENLEFTPPIFYDAQGIMVHRASDIKKIADLAGKSICVAEGTTSYNNLEDYMTQEDIKYTPLVISDKESLYNSYEHNICQAITGDISQLVARKILLANPTYHRILPQRIAQEPLAPAIVHRDSQWFDVIKWVTFALIQAEELNINSTNLSTYKNSQDLEIKRFLGKDGDLGSPMGLSNDFTVRIIKHVGNYQEIYDRNIGEPFRLKRGQNALWKDGGLMYSPPFN